MKTKILLYFFLSLFSLSVFSQEDTLKLSIRDTLELSIKDTIKVSIKDSLKTSLDTVSIASDSSYVALDSVVNVVQNSLTVAETTSVILESEELLLSLKNLKIQKQKELAVLEQKIDSLERNIVQKNMISKENTTTGSLLDDFISPNHDFVYVAEKMSLYEKKLLIPLKTRNLKDAHVFFTVIVKSYDGDVLLKNFKETISKRIDVTFSSFEEDITLTIPLDKKSLGISQGKLKVMIFMRFYKDSPLRYEPYFELKPAPFNERFWKDIISFNLNY